MLPMVSSIYGKKTIQIGSWEQRNPEASDVRHVVENTFWSCKTFFKKALQGICNY